jgi:AcrR family transcriptional regulator
MNNSSNLSLAGSFRVERGDATHEKILDAALDRFVEFGLRRNTMDDIAGSAGIGRATLYRRFGDKDQLIQAVIFRECQRNLAAIEDKLKPFTSPLDALLESFVLAVSMAHRHPLLERLLTSEPEHILPFLTNRLPRGIATFCRQHLADQIRKAQKTGCVSRRDPEHLAELLMRLVQSMLLSPDYGQVDPGDEKSLRRFAEELLHPLLSP